MTDKEKAKAYDEALKRARAIHNEKQAQCYDIMAKVFPELAESEDERIRKQCIKLIREAYSTKYEAFECIAWLEKQKERGPLTKEEEYTLYRIIEYLEDETCPSEWISLLHDIYCLPYFKQKEQKPEPKQAPWIPKFKEGDFFKYTPMSPWTTPIYEIKRIEQDECVAGYWCERIDVPTMGNIWFSNLEEKHMKYEPKPEEEKPVESWPNISNCKKDCKVCFAKCLYRKEENNEQKPAEVMKATVGNSYPEEYPLTPSECIEEPVEWSEEDKRMTNGVYDCQRVKLDSFHPIIQEFSDMLEDKPKPYWDGWYEALDYIRKKGNPFENQKPKTSMWHKADRAMLDCIIATFCEDVHGGRDTNERFITWLKALPQRFNIMQHKWDRKDAELCRAVISTIEYCKETYRDSPASVAAYDEESQWLKSLPERFNLQPKQEWSEEDEKMLNATLSFFPLLKGLAEGNMILGREGDQVKVIDECCAWLSSLRPQSPWKPTEEQMEALEYFVQKHKAESNAATCVWQDYENLVSLRNDLKKL